MMAATYEEIMAKARKLKASGDIEGAKRAAKIALARRGQSVQPPAREPQGRSFSAALYDNIIGNPDDGVQSYGETLGSLLNKGGESATFGLIGDESSAAMESLVPGVNYEDRRDHYRQQEGILERDHPALSLGAEIGGGVAGALTPIGAIGTLARGAGLVPRILASTAAGTGAAGTYGFMEGEGIEGRLDQGKTGAKIGAGVGFAAPLVGSVVQRLADSRAGRKALNAIAKKAPTTEQLRAQGRALYDEVDKAGVAIRPDRVRQQMDEITDYLRSEGAGYTGSEKVLPSSRAVMEAASDVGAGANTIPFKELDMFRRYVGSAAGKDLANKADTRAVSRASEQLDDFVRNLGPDDVDAGDIEALQSALPKAKDVWARMSRSQLLDDAIEHSADYRTGQASGLRAQFQRIVKNPNLRRGFSEAELKVMRRVVNGTLPEQVLNYMGSGLGMMGQMAVGGLTGSVPGALAGLATGAASRKGAEAVVRKNADLARAVIAGGGLKELPVASDASRRIIESLSRRGGAIIAQ